jgi:hypothetical protein
LCIAKIIVDRIYISLYIKSTIKNDMATSHPKAKRCFAWSHNDGKGDSDERFVTVLEIPPVVSPETAVKVAIVAEVRGKK